MNARGLAFASVLLTTVPAFAQPGAAPSEAPAPPAVPEVPPPPAPAGDAPALTAAYDAAFQQLVDGNPELAAAGFEAFARQSRDYQRIAAARELARVAHTLADQHARYVLGTPVDLQQTIDDDNDKDEGRTTVISFTTMYGLYAGVVLIDDLDISDVRAGVSLVAATTAVGLVGSYFATKDKHVTGAMGDAFGLGLVYGMGNAGLLLHPFGTGSSEAAQTTLLVAGGVGAAAGLGYVLVGKPTRGQLAFSSNLGILGLATTGLSLAIAQPKIDGDAALVTMAAGMDVGLGAGLGFGNRLTWSVSRARIVSLGTLLGALSGSALGLLVLGNDFDDDSERIIAATALVGVWGGFGLTTHLTRDMRPDPRFAQPDASNVQLTMLPVRGGAGVGVAGVF